jgi:lipopolysaccharide export LptBFGC system permease protein LptF
MPTATKVAVVLLALLGVFLLLNSTLTWVAQEVLVDQLVEDSGADREAAAQQLLLFLLAYGVMGLAAVLAAAFLPRHHRWARLVGILVAALLAVVTIYVVLTSGGVTPLGLLVLVVSVAAVTSLVSGQTKEWVAR